MKKVLLTAVLLSGLIFPLACSDNNAPATPGIPSGGGGGGTPTVVFVSTPGTPTYTPTMSLPAPGYFGEWGVISSPRSMYMGAPTSLFVAESDGLNPNVEVFDPAAYTNQPIDGSNFIVAGIPPVTILFAGPQGVAFTTRFGIDYYCVLDVASSGAATIYVGPDGGYPFASGVQAFWGTQNFNAPKGFTADTLGNLYVADTGNRYIKHYLVTGSPGSFWLHRWGGYFNGSVPVTFVQPSAVVCDSAGNVYVADSGYTPSIISKFSSGGITFLGAWQTMTNCVAQGLAIDPANNIYVADSANNLVAQYDNSGNLLRFWGSPNGPSQFLPFNPSCIVVTATNIYVGDANNATIEVFTP